MKYLDYEAEEIELKCAECPICKQPMQVFLCYGPIIDARGGRKIACEKCVELMNAKKPKKYIRIYIEAYEETIELDSEDYPYEEDIQAYVEEAIDNVIQSGWYEVDEKGKAL